ncbi:MAG TPA: hypothetical protein VJR47_12945 [Stellaceae bacterium]|nr:hypothetical protein [Stellaceae bacterium]
MDEGHPQGRLLWIGIEVRLDAFLAQRQENEVAFFPVAALAIDHGIALAVENVDDEAALVPVLARNGADLVREDDPVLERRVLDSRAEVVAQSSLARQLLRTLGDLADDAAECVAIGPLAAALQHDLVDILLRRFPLAQSRSLEFSQARLLRPAPPRGRREALRAADARDNP